MVQGSSRWQSAGLLSRRPRVRFPPLQFFRVLWSGRCLLKPAPAGHGIFGWVAQLVAALA